MAGAKELLKAVTAVDRAGWSAADLRQLHTEALPIARRLAPVEGLPPLPSSEFKGIDKVPFVLKVVSIIVWVLRGLHDQHFTGEELTQQACELLCALSDVLHVMFIVDQARPSSSRSRQVRSTAFSRFLKLDDAAESTIYTFADIARKLNQHVLQRASSVPPQLLMTATLCCQRICYLLLDWQIELKQHGTLGDIEHCRMLVAWSVDSGLLCELAEGELLVLRLDAAPFLARGAAGVEELTNTMVMAMTAANNLQGFVIASSGWLQQVGEESKHTALVVGLQGTGSDQTAPAPFLRLMLLWLAISQYWKRANTLPPGSLPLQPRSSSQAKMKALCAAVQQQLTPSCCFQLLKRLAPAYWAVVTAQQVPPPLQQLVTLSQEDDCGAHMGAWLQDVGAIATYYEAGGPPCAALAPRSCS